MIKTFQMCKKPEASASGFHIVGLFQHFQKLRFRQYRNSQLIGFFQLGTGIFTGYHIAGLFGDGTGGLAAAKLNPFRGLLPGEERQRPGENKGFSGKPVVLQLPGGLEIDPASRGGESMLGLGLRKPVQEAEGCVLPRPEPL